MDVSWGVLGICGAVFLAHTLVIILSSQPELSGDEPRYRLLAQNLLQGRFATHETRLLWNGPGYPLTLLPWAYLETGPLFPRLVNAVWMALQALGAWLWFRSLGLPRPQAHAALLSLYLFLHGSMSHRIMSEPFAVACLTFAAWGMAKAWGEAPPQSGSPNLGFGLAALALAALALTKVFFGYMLMLALGATLFLAIAKGRNGILMRFMPRLSGLFALALILCSPYLLYAWQLTGRFPYWGNSGGAQVYCLSLPEPRFLGDWFNSDAVMENREFFGEHSRLYASINNLSFVAQDDSLKKWAWENIRKHPKKAFANWRANVNRMILGHPRSQYPGASPELKSGNRGMVQGLWFYALLPALWILFRQRLTLPLGLALPLVFALASALGLSLISTEPRMAFPLLPLFYGGIAFAFHRIRDEGNPSRASTGGN